MEEVDKLLAKSYPEFGITMDGSPYFAEAFAMLLRVVDKETWEIRQPLVNVSMYDNSLNGEAMAGHVLEVLEEQLKLPLKDWLVAMEDCCAVNHAALNRIRAMANINPLEAPCASHGNSNAGKKMEYPLGRVVPSDKANDENGSAWHL
jgi:hypothetical protein